MPFLFSPERSKKKKKETSSRDIFFFEHHLQFRVFTPVSFRVLKVGLFLVEEHTFLGIDSWDAFFVETLFYLSTKNRAFARRRRRRRRRLCVHDDQNDDDVQDRRRTREDDDDHSGSKKRPQPRVLRPDVREKRGHREVLAVVRPEIFPARRPELLRRERHLREPKSVQSSRGRVRGTIRKIVVGNGQTDENRRFRRARLPVRTDDCHAIR